MKWSSKYPPMPLRRPPKRVGVFSIPPPEKSRNMKTRKTPTVAGFVWKKTPGEALRIFGPKNMELSVAILIKRQKGGDVGEEDVIWVMVGVYLASNPLIWQVGKMIFAFKGLVPEGTDILRTDVVELRIVPSMRKGRLEMLFKLLLW